VVSLLGAHPSIFEINTWVWLEDLSAKLGRTVTLATIPVVEWDELAAISVDAVWLMGVWERSPVGTRVAQLEEWLLYYGQANVPDFTLDDIVGSPYCVRRYVPDERMGGFAGLAVAREQLRARGMALILDYVPNHLARDHPWVIEHPDYFIQGSEADLENLPGQFVRAGSGIMALGRDPYFPPWRDVLQLNGFHQGMREAAIATLSVIGEHCDGVRCDMAMLLLNDQFSKTWGERAGPIPETEYWSCVIPVVKKNHPDMTFIAEVYWGLERVLLQQGFDYCYDKVLYDRLLEGDPEPVRLHLRADYSYQRQLVRFLENHDEERASAVLSPGALRAAAVLISTLPGAVLYHHGQLTGRTLHIPVALGRMPPEPEDSALQEFYGRLINASRTAKRGTWWFCEVRGLPYNDSCRNILAWCWRADKQLHLTVVNLASTPSQGRVQVPADALPADVLVLTDVFSETVFDRQRRDLLEQGFHVELGGYGFHLLSSR
jgi:hypothetical protein